MFDKKKFALTLLQISSEYDNQREFADKSSVNRTTLSKYINLKIDNPPKPSTLQKIADASHNKVTYNDLMVMCGYYVEGHPGTHNSINEFDMFYKELNLNRAEQKYTSKIYNVYASINFEGFNAASVEESVEIITKGVLGVNKRKIKLAVILLVVKYILIDLENLNDCYDCDSVKIPVIGKITAGTPIEAIEDIIDEIEIDGFLAKTGTYFALEVKGNSMEPDIKDGSIAIIKQQSNVENGEIAAVLFNGDNEATLKRVYKDENGITLVPDNPNNSDGYRATYYTNEDIINIPITICGKLVEVRKKYY